MLDIFSGLRLVVKRRSINIDNAIFRCHWFFTSTLLVSFSLIITARQYVGQPIECHSVDKIPDSLLNSYCWVQSTFTVPQACNQLYGIEVPYPCIDNTRGREIKIYAYYQWVGIVLFIQGLLFHLPYYLWKLWENGLIKAITGGLRVAMLNEQERAKKKEIVVEYIHDHLGCHRRYAFKYFLCEFICLVNLLGQLWATNKFFDGQFLRYGIEVLEYSSSSISSQFYSSLSMQTTISSNSQYKQQQQQQLPSNIQSNSTIRNNNYYYSTLPQNKQQNIDSNNNNNPLASIPIRQQVDPMTYIFPRMTKCTYFDFGSSGDVQKHDALCLLPLNIINEKIYIVLWFWFLILALLTLLVIIYRIFAILCEDVRCKGLMSRCKLSSERDIRLICHHCDVGDWFLFYMVAENLDPLIMREIVASIAIKINEHLELKRELKQQIQQQQQLDEIENEKLRIIMNEQYRQRVANYHNDPNDGHPAAGAAAAPEYSTSSRRNSLVDQVPIVRKIKKRLYNKRLWSIDLGSGDLRQQLFSAHNNTTGHSAGSTSRSMNQQPPVDESGNGRSRQIHQSGDNSPGVQTNSFVLASAPPASAMPLNSRPTGVVLQRRANLTRKASSTSSSGVSSVGSSGGSFVMEMSTISGSTPCLDNHFDNSTTRSSPTNSRWRNSHHYHES